VEKEKTMKILMAMVGMVLSTSSFAYTCSGSLYATNGYQNVPDTVLLSFTDLTGKKKSSYQCDFDYEGFLKSTLVENRVAFTAHANAAKMFRSAARSDLVYYVGTNFTVTEDDAHDFFAGTDRGHVNQDNADAKDHTKAHALYDIANRSAKSEQKASDQYAPLIDAETPAQWTALETQFPVNSK
jgi:hypothetical protein